MLNHRYLQYWHTRFNNLLFNGRLARVPIVLRDLTAENAEALYWPKAAGGPHIEICNTLTDRTAVRAALLHEMVHQYQELQGAPLEHGQDFKDWRAECFARTGLTI